MGFCDPKKAQKPGTDSLGLVNKSWDFPSYSKWGIMPRGPVGLLFPTPSLALQTDVLREKKRPDTGPASGGPWALSAPHRVWGRNQDTRFGHDRPEMLVRHPSGDVMLAGGRAVEVSQGAEIVDLEELLSCKSLAYVRSCCQLWGCQNLDLAKPILP